MSIVATTKIHIPEIARLHCLTIDTGFTAWLGQRFCEKLYWGMARTPYSFVLVYEDDRNRVLGFVCGTTNTTKMYRHLLFRRFFSLAFAAIGKLLRPSVISHVFSAIRRPKTFSEDDFSGIQLPEAELVSIAVQPQVQGRGIGKQLLEALFTRFNELGCDRVRVWTIEENKQATAFYLKNGFKFLGKRKHHTGIRLFVADLSEHDKAQ